MKKKYLFWITGLPGSGKTTIAKNIKKDIEKAYGPTIEISGDNLRKIFKFKSFKMKEREKYAKNYSAFCKFLINKGYNVIFSTVSFSTFPIVVLPGSSIAPDPKVVLTVVIPGTSV